MNRDAEIALARSAAPGTISRDASVLVLTGRGYEYAVQGKNGQRAPCRYTAVWRPVRLQAGIGPALWQEQLRSRNFCAFDSLSSALCHPWLSEPPFRPTNVPAQPRTQSTSPGRR